MSVKTSSVGQRNVPVLPLEMLASTQATLRPARSPLVMFTKTLTLASKSGNVYAIPGIWLTADGSSLRLKGLVISPEVIGQRPGKVLPTQGSTVVRMIWYPYARIVMSNFTKPSIVEVAIMFIATVLLLGVKTTSKRLAVKREPSWHVARELDRRIFCPLTAGRQMAR